MASASGGRADTAYDRALRAFEERSYDVARSWALDALAEDPHHAGARALLTRLDAMRPPGSPFDSPSFGTGRGPATVGHGPKPGRAPEPISTDPNVLISRASGPDAAEPIEPTMIIQRDDPRRRPPAAGGWAAAPPPRHTAAAPVPEPTVIVQPTPRRGASGARPASGSGAVVPSLWQRLRGGGTSSPSARRPHSAGRVGTTSDPRAGMWTPGLRGALIVIAAIAVSALVVWAAVGVWRWLWPGGELLMITKPAGGTIIGPGIRCGTRGANCSTTVPTGELVQLEVEADAGYVYSGFTGDCAPSGRSFMSQARTCGATFDKMTAPPPPATFTLTITKPVGGSVLGPEGILCGILGQVCSAELPSGVPVTLRFQADTGYTFSQFTGDCDARGETTMTAPRTCSVAFAPTTTPGAYTPPARPPKPQGPKPENVIAVGPLGAAPPPPPSVPPTTQQPTVSPPAAGGTPSVDTIPTNPDKPAAPPISAEEHAKAEIQQLVKNYCSALETLKAERVKEWFPLAPQSELHERFRQYKTLQCSLTGALEFERLNADPAGVAQVKFEMKQVIQMRSGGAPQKLETIVKMTISRLDLRSPWLIDRLRAEPKPKP